MDVQSLSALFYIFCWLVEPAKAFSVAAQEIVLIVGKHTFHVLF